MKHYISIYFSNRESVAFMKEKQVKIKYGVSCIKITDNQEFLIEEIKEDIALCFEDQKR